MPLGKPFEPQPPSELIMEMWQGENEIQKTSELPKIVPPLPTGDTKDLKVWRDYWKQHDEHVRQSERENLLDELEKWGSGYYGYDINIQTLKEKIGCLRRKAEKQ